MPGVSAAWDGPPRKGGGGAMAGAPGVLLLHSTPLPAGGAATVFGHSGGVVRRRGGHRFHLLRPRAREFLEITRLQVFVFLACLHHGRLEVEPCATRGTTAVKS